MWLLPMSVAIQKPSMLLLGPRAFACSLNEHSCNPAMLLIAHLTIRLCHPAIYVYRMPGALHRPERQAAGPRRPCRPCCSALCRQVKPLLQPYV